MAPDLVRRLVAEALGTALLLAAIVGSGIMAERLSTDVGVQLLCNALATGAALFVLIAVLAPVSGAHFNPAVTLAAALTRELPAGAALAYGLVQIAAGVAGVALAHLMFSLPLLETGIKERTGGGLWLSEFVAAFGLVFVIRLARTRPVEAIAAIVALYIVSAYWFTASTSFANPAVTVARSLTRSFAGIRPLDAPAFVLAQLAGAVAALVLSGWLGRRS